MSDEVTAQRKAATEHALEGLVDGAKTTADVAWRINTLGIKAVPGDSCQCAVAMYLDKVTGNPWHVVGGMMIEVGTAITVPTPDLVRQFIKEFDEAKFPELIRRGAYLDQPFE